MHSIFNSKIIIAELDSFFYKSYLQSFSFSKSYFMYPYVLESILNRKFYLKSSQKVYNSFDYDKSLDRD